MRGQIIIVQTPTTAAASRMRPISTNGGWLSICFEFNLTATLRLISGIRTAQARRIADGEIELMFARDDGAAGDVAGQIVRMFRERFGSNPKVCQRGVHEIVRTNTGKFMTIVD